MIQGIVDHIARDIMKLLSALLAIGFVCGVAVAVGFIVAVYHAG